MPEPKIREQLSAIRQVIADTRKGELSWTATGRENFFASRVGRDQSLLGREDDGLIEIQFMTDDRPEFTVRLAQLGASAEPTNDELSRDGLLSLLFDEVQRYVNPGDGENAMRRFTQRE